MPTTEAPPISPLVAQLMTASLTQTQEITNRVIENLTRERDDLRAELAAIRTGITQLLSGPYVPTSHAVEAALWPNADAVNAHRATEEVPVVTHPAYRCETCHGVPLWSIERHGDVATSWACADDLSAVCEALQRDWEVTELAVVLFAKACEWSGLGATLNAIAKEGL